MPSTATAPQVTTCRDCGGPTRQAFATTTAYVSCRRCGHVFAAEVYVENTYPGDAAFAGLAQAMR